MNISEFENYIDRFFDPLFSFAFAMIPDQLQASQICIDSISAFLVENKIVIRKFIEASDEQRSERSTEIQEILYSYAFNLSQKREGHLGHINQDNFKDFYELNIKERALLFLREKTSFSLNQIERIVGLRNYEIINLYELAKNKLSTRTTLSI